MWLENGLVISNSVELELIKRNAGKNVSRQHKSYFDDQIKISRYLKKTF